MSRPRKDTYRAQVTMHGTKKESEQLLEVLGNAIEASTSDGPLSAVTLQISKLWKMQP